MHIITMSHPAFLELLSSEAEEDEVDGEAVRLVLDEDVEEERVLFLPGPMGTFNSTDNRFEQHRWTYVIMNEIYETTT